MTIEKENKRMQFLAKKWQDGTITEQEKNEFNNWYNSFDDNDIAYISDQSPDLLKARMLKNIHMRENMSFQQKRWPTPYVRIAVAASFLLICSAAIYFSINRTKKELVVKNVQKDVLPGKNKAVLVLANGSKINLDDVSKGELAKQAGITITKTSSGRIVYTVSDNSLANSKPTYNTVETPRGGQYQINLPDGTKVWLNAASVIKFPTSFPGKERNVTLTGEAYFEVAHNANKPFNVYAAGTQVQVLGTHFNVNAYKDEDTVKTTLLEGSVRLTYQHTNAMLKPGQQGGITADAEKFNVSAADTSLVMAWKNGIFEFDNTDLHSLMRQISRWYNIDVVYEKGIPNDVYFGSIGRNSKLSNVLKILELGGVHFKIEDKKLIVMP